MTLRWTLVFITVVVFYGTLSSACTFDHRGGPARPDASFWTPGCSSGCPAGEPQVHVIAQLAGSDLSTSQANNTVTVSIQKGCREPISIILVLVSVHPIQWVLSYMENGGITLMDVYTFQEFVPHSTSVTFMGATISTKGQQITQQLDLRSNGTAVQRVLQTFGINTIQSISRANWPKTWKLNLQCCDSQQPTSQPPPDTTDTVTTNTEKMTAASGTVKSCTFDHRGGPARPAASFWTPGCSYGCPAGEPQVHVIAQIAGHNLNSSQANNTVTVSIQKSCRKPIPIILVLVSVHPIQWVLSYVENGGITLMDVYAFQEFAPHSTSVTSMGAPISTKGQQITQQLDIRSNGTSVQRVLQTFGINTIQSISRADWPKTWKLNLQCCDSGQPTSQPPPDTSDTVITNTGNMAAASGTAKCRSMTVIIAVCFLLTV